METIKLSEIQKAKNILILSGDIQINKIKKELLKYDEDILVIIFDKSYNTQKYLKINNALSKFNKKTVSLKFFNWNAFHSGLVKKWNSHKISFDKILRRVEALCNSDEFS